MSGVVSLSSVLFHCPRVFLMTVLCYFFCCSFALLRSGTVLHPPLLMLPRTDFAILDSFWSHRNLKVIFSSFGRNAIGAWIGIALNHISFGRTAILTMRVLSIQEEGISFQFFNILFVILFQDTVVFFVEPFYFLDQADS